MARRTGGSSCALRGSAALFCRLIPAVLFLSMAVPGAFSENALLFNPAPGQSSRQMDRDEGRQENFLFSEPKGFIGFRIGRFFPKTDSEVFDFVTETLTLEKNDFRAWDFALDAGFALNKRIDIVFGAEYMKRTKGSEYRDWLDDRGLPITQRTYYSQFPMTVGVKILLIPRGRQIGQYAWVPSNVVPYVCGGGGILWYRFGQYGDFVKFDTLEIFPDDLESSGWAATGYLGGGLDIRIARNTYVTLDARYSRAKVDLSGSYVGLKPLDLSGGRVSAGLQWHF
jgi:hypothetical protein